MNFFCRLCLCQSQDCISLFENNGNKMVESLTSIKIQQDDNLPLGACNNCWQNLKLAYRIQQDILICDKKLRLTDCPKVLENNNFSNLNIENSFKVLTDFPAGEGFLNSIIIKQETDINNIIEQESDFFIISPIAPFTAKCKICHEQTDNTGISEHLKNHFSLPRKCETCDIKCENLNSLQNHKIKEHCLNSEQTFACDECGYYFKYEFFYEIHREKVHASKRRKIRKINKSEEEAIIEKPLNNLDPKTIYLKCDFCTATYRTKWGLKNHALLKHEITLELETENPVPKYRECPFCPKLYTSDRYKGHLDTHAGPSVCDICGAILKHAKSLKRHLKVHSNIKSTVKCEFCEKTFIKTYSRKIHVDRYHNGKAKYICDVCGKKFYSGTTLTKHVQMTHIKLRSHACDYCDKSFYSRFLLKAHLRQHTNDTPFQCDECGEAFKHNVSLKTHKKSKHNIEEEKKVCCKICGKGFASEMAVSCHMKKHK